MRNLEREIATCCRKIAKDWLASGRPETKIYEVTPESLTIYLGVEKYRANAKEEEDEIGLANGLAVTIHRRRPPGGRGHGGAGQGQADAHRQARDVMQESAQAAMSYVRSRAQSLGLTRDFQTKIDIHVHFPEALSPRTARPRASRWRRPSRRRCCAFPCGRTSR